MCRLKRFFFRKTHTHARNKCLPSLQSICSILLQHHSIGLRCTDPSTSGSSASITGAAACEFLLLSDVCHDSQPLI